jgi:hypothetical protein
VLHPSIEPDNKKQSLLSWTVLPRGHDHYHDDRNQQRETERRANPEQDQQLHLTDAKHSQHSIRLAWIVLALQFVA